MPSDRSDLEFEPENLEEEAERALRVQSAAPVGSEIELTDASERFITQDDGDNDVSGGGGSDALITSGGLDTLRGGSGEDVLFAGSGDDTLIGGSGSDELNGGTGADEFVVQASDFEEGPSFQADIITDFEVGVDTLRLLGFDAISEFDDLVFLPVETGLGIVLGEEQFIVLEGINSVDDLDSQSFEFAPAAESEPTPAPEPLYLTEANDRYITTGDADDVVFALGGDDAVVAAGGNDSIVGGDGFDVLFGGAGDDTLEGGALGDDLTGGVGSDLFRFALSDFTGDQPLIVDFIKDYEAGVDSIELVGFDFGSLDEVTALNVATGLALEVATNRYIVFEGISSKDDLDPTDFVFVGGNEAPLITSVALANDTGADDGVSNDPAISGTVEDADGTVAEMEISVNGSAFQDVSEALDGAGGFELSQETLEVALGSALPDGALSVDIRIRDDGGLFSEVKSFQSTLDRTAEPLSEVGLAPSSDTGIAGDGITALRSVRLTGEGEPGGTVTDGVISTIVGNNGIFVLDGVAVGVGDNRISLTQTDPAGNTSQTVLDVTGIQSAEGQPVLVWNDITLEAIAGNAANPLEASRILAMQSVAVHDALAAIDGSPAFQAALEAEDGASVDAAIAAVSHGVLRYAFPGFEAELDAYLEEFLDDLGQSAARDNGVVLGAHVAASIIATRDIDGWDDFEIFEGIDMPGAWRETGPFFNTAVDPQYATMTPWTLMSADQMRTDGPLSLLSEAYAEALELVRELGAIDSATRSADQTEAALFWKDGLGTETTPGHWNSIATDFLKQENLSASDNARALTVLNVAVADAMIAAWDTKYNYTFWRPEDAIASADEDGNAATAVDGDWVSLMLSPAHPEYVSGHAAASGAAAEILTQLFGEQAFTTSSLGLEGVERSFASYWDAALENADSRLWGGVHFDFSNQDGLDLGRKVASWALEAFDTSQDSTPPLLLLDFNVAYVSELDFAVTGSVLDGLSGVESLSVSQDGGEPEAVIFDEMGQFSFSVDTDTQGSFSYGFVAVDARGNVSEVASVEIVIDRTDPAVMLTSLDQEGGLSGEDIRLSGTVDGTGAPIVALSYQINDGPVVPIGFDLVTGEFDIPADLSRADAGAHVLAVLSVDAAGNSARETFSLTLDQSIPFTVTRTYPIDGAGEIGTAFRPEIHFSRPVDPATVTQDSFQAFDASGAALGGKVVVSPDGLTAWMFFDAPLPGSNQIILELDGATITALDGTMLEEEGASNASGGFSMAFKTVATSFAPGTSLSGFVVDPGDDLKPMTVDDFSVGPDGAAYTDDDIFRAPIAGAEVWILGSAAQKVTTDENGYFELTDVPVGNVKVAIDGRTATNAPEGVFWPEMVMDATLIAGQDNTLMASMGDSEDRVAAQGRGEIYLPRVSTEILTALSDTQETEITVPAAAAQDLTQEQRETIRLVVQPGTTLDAFGNPVATPEVGISTVPPELVRDMLPDGILQHGFDITIQAPDAAVFTEPAALTLPNVFDAEPGTKLNLLSFDHTTGRLVIEGTATVSEDGLSITTDEGTGVTKPGWHNFTPQGSRTTGPQPGAGSGDGDGEPDPDDPCVEEEANVSEDIKFYAGLARDITSCLAELNKFAKFKEVLKLISDVSGCAGAVAEAASRVQSIVDDIRAGNKPAVTDVLAYVNAIKTKFIGLVEKAVAALTDVVNNVSPLLECVESAANILSAVCGKALKGLECKDEPQGLFERFFDAAYEIGLKAVCSVVEGAKATIGFVKSVMSDAEAGILKFGKDLLCAAIDGNIAQIEVWAAGNDPQSAAPLAQAAPVVSDEEAIAALEEISAYMTGAMAEVQQVELDAIEADDLLDNDPSMDAGYYEENFALLTNGIVGVLANATFSVEYDGQVLRGTTDANGAIDIFLPAETEIVVRIYDKANNLIGETSGTTEISGVQTVLDPFFFYSAEGLTDTDGDLLVDEVEEIIGTSATLADTDGDLLTDYIEVLEGLDPLGAFGTANGIVASLALSGEVLDIHIASGPGNLNGPVALVLTEAGLAIVDISTPRLPLLLAQYDLDGMTPVDSAFDPALDRVLVVGSNGALQSFDLSDPLLPAAGDTLLNDVQAVEIHDGIALVATDNALITLEVSTGQELDSAQFANSGAVRGLTMEANTAYVFDTRGDLIVATVLADGELLLGGKVATGLSSSKRDLFVAEDVVYIGATNGFNGGYITIDVSDPFAPELISGADDTGIAGGEIALNGAGKGLLIGSPGGAFGIDTIDVVNTDDPANTGDFITRYTLDASPTAVSIAAGVGYVGDESGMLHAVNFQSFDVLGIAPVIDLDFADLDADPLSEGIQFLEGSQLNFNSVVRDDVGLREVSLLVDDQVTTVDLTYPFDLGITIPLLGEGVSSTDVTVQIRAVDTGGNIGLSEMITAEIVPDTVAPTILSTSFEEGEILGRSSRSFSFSFDEPLDPATVTTDNFALVGSDGIVVPELIQLRGGDRVLSVVFDTLEEGAYAFEFTGDGLADVKGNALPGDLSLGFEIGTYTNEWTGLGATDLWSNPDNWSAGRVPDETDDVFIGTAAPQSVNLGFNAGEIQLASLTSEDMLSLSFGTRVIVEGLAELADVKIASSSGYLELNGASEIGRLDLQSGNLRANADVEIEERLDWLGGALNGPGKVIVTNGALGLFGTQSNPETGAVAQTSLYLATELVLEGDAILDGGLLRLGSRIYNAELGQYDHYSGVVRVSEGAVLEFASYRADMVHQYNGELVNNGLINEGTILKTGGGVSNLLLANGKLGTATDQDGQFALISGTTFEVDDADDFGGLTGLNLSGATLILNTDVTLGQLDFVSGAISGAGDLTIGEHLDWSGGVFSGEGKVVIGTEAHAEFGRDYVLGASTFASSLSSYRDIVVEGTAFHQGAIIKLGTQFFDPVLGVIVNVPSVIEVSETGRYTMDSPRATIEATNTNASGNGLKLLGTLGVGATVNADILFAEPPVGTFDLGTGTVELSQGSFTLTQAMVDAGLTSITLAGGTLFIEDDILLPSLTLQGGVLDGAGALNVDQFQWANGVVVLEGGLRIPEDGVALFEGASSFSGTLATDLDVAGTLEVGRGTLALGRSNYDPELAQVVVQSGVITLGETARAELIGDNIRLISSQSEEGKLSGVLVLGSLEKTGEGTAQIALLEGSVGALEYEPGALVIGSGVTVVTSEMIAAGLTDITVLGGRVEFHEDVVLERLVLQGGEIAGSGEVAVSGSLALKSGLLSGTGRLVAQEGTLTEFGNPPDVFGSSGTLRVLRDIDLAGRASYGSVSTAFGQEVYDSNLGAYVFTSGRLNILETGHLDVTTSSGGLQVSTAGSDGRPNGIINAGVITKSEGQNVVNLALTQSTGTVTADAGSFALAPNATLVMDGQSNASVLDALNISGGTLRVLEDLSIANLTLSTGGRVEALGHLSIEQGLDWAGGVIDGIGSVEIGELATAVVDSGFSGAKLLGDLSVSGALILDQSRLELGERYYDSALQDYVEVFAQLTINPDGVLTLEGDGAELRGERVGYDLAEIINDGQLISAGSGEKELSSSLTLSGDGAFVAQDGALVIGPDAVFEVGGASQIDHIRLAGGTLLVEQVASIGTLSIESGVLSGAQDLTVSGYLGITGGSLEGSGRLIIGTGATALLGLEDTGETIPSTRMLQMSRELVIAGQAQLESAVLQLGTSETAPSGSIQIDPAGSLELNGGFAEISVFDSGAGQASVIDNAGSLIKTGSGTSSIDPSIQINGAGDVAAQDGLLELEGGSVGSFAPPDPLPIYVDNTTNGQIRELDAADAGASVSLNGGTLIVTEDVTVENLAIGSGTLRGEGSITVTGALFWQNGFISGGGGNLRLSEGATGIFGTALDADNPVFNTTLILGRELLVEGDLELAQADLRLGNYTQSSFYAGVVDIAETGSFEIADGRSSVSNYYVVANAQPNGIIVDGVLRKFGPGDAEINVEIFPGSTGQIIASDGTLELTNNAVLTVTDQLDLSGVERIVLNGGRLEVSDDFKIAELVVERGTVTGEGDLTITSGLVIENGVLSGPGSLTLAEGSHSRISNPSISNSAVLIERKISLEGDMSIENVTLVFGSRTYDPEIRQYVEQTGTLDVEVSGTLTLAGSGLSMGVAGAAEGEASGVTNAGQIKLKGTQVGGIVFADQPSGSFELGDSELAISNGAGDLILTQAMVDAGMSSIQLQGAETLIVNEDIILADLTLAQGTVTGSGSITVTGRFEMTNGTLGGEGELLIAPQASALFLAGALRRDVALSGSAEFDGRLSFGSQTYVPELGQFVDTDAQVRVSETGTATLLEGADLSFGTENSGFTNEGLIEKNNESETWIRLVGVQSGQFEMGASGFRVADQSTFELTQELVDAGINHVEVVAGTLLIEQEVTLPELSISGFNSGLDGAGNLTITEDFDWTSGQLRGSGTLVLEDTAQAQFGVPFVQGATAQSTGTLMKQVEVEGKVHHSGMRIDLGGSVYNSDLGQNEVFDGVINIGTGAELILQGRSADYRSVTATLETSGIVNNGAITKLGGGTSDISLLSNTGTFEITNGDLVLIGGALKLTQDLIDQGLNSIVLEGGNLIVGSDLDLSSLDVRGGVLSSSFDIIVRDQMVWSDGQIDMNTQTLTLASTADAVFGSPWDPETGLSFSQLDFIGDMDVEGRLQIDNADVSLVTFNNFPEQGSSGYEAGRIDVLSGGSMVLNGPFADITAARLDQIDEGVFVGVRNDGSLVKSGGGDSSMLLYGASTGSFDLSEGRLIFDQGAVSMGLNTQAMNVTAGMVAQGLSMLVVKDTVVVIDENVTLEQLHLSGTGGLAGSGDIAISETFSAMDAQIAGSGSLTILETATGLFGSVRDGEAGLDVSQVELGRHVQAEGGLRLEQVDLVLGDVDFDFLTGAPDGTVLIDVTETGTVTFFGEHSDIVSVDPMSVGSLDGLTVAGDIIKLGGGVSAIDENLLFENFGTFRLLSGQFDAPGTENDFGF